MSETASATAHSETHAHSEGALLRSIVIGLTAFLTVVDLFATQAILPSLTRHYGVTPAAMGFAVNASTLGMAFSGLAIGYFSREIDRRKGILASLVLLAIPTALLAHAPDLTTFTLLRVAQGLCMAAAFTLTLAYLGEHYSAADSASAFAAYITGNVASNLIGRLISAAVADHFGLASNFYFFAALNLLGAVLVFFTVERTPCMTCVTPAMGSHFSAWVMHLKNASLRASFAIGFCILFAFIGTFTFVNFVLVQPPLGVSAMTLGFVYFVFLPAMATTPLAGRAVSRFGTRPTFWAALGVAAVGLPLLVLPSLPAVLLGMVLVAPEPSSPKPAPPASLAARRPPNGARRAASISLPTSLAAWSGARCSGRSSTCSAGKPASPASRSRCLLRRSWRSSSRRRWPLERRRTPRRARGAVPANGAPR
jgi:MFS transporter, YNFM family, putative membrane transport protein